MTEAVKVGADLAWRLLATLEGGTILVVTSALIAYMTRLRLTKHRRHKAVNTVLVTNTTSTLGRELKCKLVAHGCTVSTVDTASTDKVDSLVVIGAEAKTGLDGISQLVSKDIYENLNFLESLSGFVKSGGCIVWVCTGDDTGTYEAATAAFDTVVHASLQHIAEKSHCEPIWVGRCNSTELAVDRIFAQLLPHSSRNLDFSIRNAAHNVSVFLGRWLKMIT